MIVTIFFAATPVLVAQLAPVLVQGYAGAVIVSGWITPGNGSVTIYDNSYPAHTKLGMSRSIDGNGNFAVSIKVPSMLGHQIVAVDLKGATSEVMIVVAPPPGPTGR